MRSPDKGAYVLAEFSPLIAAACEVVNAHIKDAEAAYRMAERADSAKARGTYPQNPWLWFADVRIMKLAEELAKLAD
jgi:hypothetical protein